LSTPFQNRLVGTIIISAVAIIFLPDILDGEKNGQQTSFEPIPKPPVYQGDKQVKTFPTAQLAHLPKVAEVDEQPVDEPAHKSTASSAVKAVTQTTTSNANVVVNTVKPTETFKDATPQIIVTNPNTNVVKSNSAAQTVSNTKLATDKSVTAESSSTDANLATSDNSLAWVLQLGSFKHQKNVDALIKTLKEHGYVAFTRPIKTHNGYLTKVFIGPELSKTVLTSKITALKTLTGMQGKLSAFNPAK